MNPLLKEIRHNPLLWLLAFVPVVFAAHKLKPEVHTARPIGVSLSRDRCVRAAL
jgi:hypothetical protein